MVSSKKYNNYTYGNLAYEMPEEKKEKQKISSPKKTRPSAKLKLRAITYVLAIFSLSFLVLLRFSYIYKINSDIRAVKQELKVAENNNENVRVEIAKLNNIKSIEDAALKAGMIVPDKANIRYVKTKPLTAVQQEPEPHTDSLMQRLFGIIF
jgi:cell division protein FtsL